MAANSPYAQKALLDWMLGGAVPTRPSARYMGLSIGAPSSTSASEATASGYARQTFSAAAAGTPASSGTVSNAAACVFTFSAAQTIRGIHIWDAVSGGNMLFYASHSAASSVMASGDTFSFAIASVILNMA
jgi:hypothetical protein